MEETKTKTTKAKDDSYVTFGPLFYDGKNYKNPVNVIVNGVKYSVPRGKTVKVPKVVAEVLNQSMAQDAYAAEVDAEAQREQVQSM